MHFQRRPFTIFDDCIADAPIATILIVIAMHDQGGHVDALQIVGLVGL